MLKRKVSSIFIYETICVTEISMPISSCHMKHRETKQYLMLKRNALWRFDVESHVQPQFSKWTRMRDSDFDAQLKFSR